MTVDLSRLVHQLNRYLEVDRFTEPAINGLQVAGKKKVRRIAFAVDGVLETFERAAEQGADMIIVHHGIYWGHQYALRGPDYRRIKVLMDHEIALYAVHLPLDAHPTVGHNVNLLKGLGVKPDSMEPFGNYRGTTIGFQGTIAETKRDALSERLADLLGGPVQLLGFGPDKVKRVACITGGAADFGMIREAKIRGVHFYISGEGNHPIYHYAREHKVTVALGGHYRTETFGLHALASYIEAEYGLETFFIDSPTGM